MSHLSDIKPGQVIGRYEFLAPIAQGGMAAVWGARQRGSRGFSKVVAIKTMLPSISDDPRFEKMFLAEAQIASRIRHSNVVQILDLGEENNILYLVMEWVDGESLSALRRRAAEQAGIPLRLAVRIVADVCAGLHAAHELTDDEGCPFGLVHRDVSPQNVLVGYDGNVKILDFGVAKLAGRTTDTTNIGQARGKPPYMAPEQALGKEIDRRADIFALGIIFYQLLVGRHPFRGENDIATLHNIISDQVVVAPSAVDQKISAQIERIVLTALAREPERRFQTAQEFELALEAALDSEIGRVRPEEIARLMAETFGVLREDRRSAIREAIRRVDTSESRQLEVLLTPPNGVESKSRPRNREENIATSTLGIALVAEPVEADSGLSAPASNGRHQLVGNGTARVVDRADATRPAIARAMSGWMRLLVAMGLGAVLAWIWLGLIAVKSVDLPPNNVSSSMAPTAVVQGTTMPLSTSSAAVSSAAHEDPPEDAAVQERGGRKKPDGIQRIPQSNKRPAGDGKVNRPSGLPPVPSPGF